jgi:hypothetical protein
MKPTRSVAALATAVALAVSACESTETKEAPPPKSGVNVLSDDGSIVDVNTDDSKVYVGDEGVRVNAPGTNINIGEHGIRIRND